MTTANLKTKSGKPLFPIGIGTYGVGGRGHRDMEVTEKLDDATYIDALAYTLKQGSNFTELSLGYGHGGAIKLFKRSLDQSLVKRDDVFLTHSLYTRDLPDTEIIRQDIHDFYVVMDTDYADSTLITQSLILRFGEPAIYGLLHDLLQSGQSRYVSLSNASPTWIRKFKQEFGDKFFAHEGHLSFEVRALQDKGVFELCDELGVANIIWRPLRRSKTLQHNWPLLLELASKYQKTQSQIVLNWMCHLGYRPMVFSTNRQHIDENLAASDFAMGTEDYQRITDFRP